MFYFWRKRPNIDDYFELEERNLVLPEHGFVNIKLAKYKWDALELFSIRSRTTIVAVITQLMGAIKPNYSTDKYANELEDGIDFILTKRFQHYSDLIFKPSNKNTPNDDLVAKSVPEGNTSLLGYKHAEKARNFIINALPNASYDYLSRLVVNYTKYFQESDERFAAKAKPPEIKPIN